MKISNLIIKRSYKSIISLMTICAIVTALFFAFPFSASAEVVNGVVVTVDNVNAMPGDTVNVPVRLTGNPTNGISGFTVRLGFDDTKMTFLSVDTAGTIVPANISISSNLTATKKIVILGSNATPSDNPINTTGIMFNVKFKINTDAPSGKYSVKREDSIQTQTKFTSPIDQSVYSNLNFIDGSITVGGASDTTAPTIQASNPINGATNVVIDAPISVKFSEAIAEGVNYSQISLQETNGVAIAINKSISVDTLTIAHNVAFVKGKSYTVTIPAGAVMDSSSNALSAIYSFTFKVVDAPLVPTVPSAKLSIGTNAGTVKLIDVNNTMSYKVGETAAYTAITTTSVDNINVNIGDVIHVIVNAVGDIPASPVQDIVVAEAMIKPATAPSTPALEVGTMPLTTKLVSVDNTMEYKIDNGNYVSITTTATQVDNIPVTANQHIFVRTKGTPLKPASYEKDIIVTADVIKPSYGLGVKLAPTITSFKIGNDADVSVEFTNGTTSNQKATLIIALFDGTKMVKHTYVKTTLVAGSTNTVEAGFDLKGLVAENNRYQVKCFVWDGTDTMKALSDVITIPVVQ